jgi:hypothetical protein
LAGCSPDCASARAAAAPAANERNLTVAPARQRGRRCTRIHASVMTPSAPSEPSHRRSGAGPAPDAGSRRVATVPRGVTTVSAWQKSSMWVGPVAKWPPARVASHPPSVENANDCG